MIRTATADDAPAIGHVHVESWRSTYRGLMPDAMLENLSAEQRATFWRGVIERAEKQFVFVATDTQGDVVGFVNGGLEREHDPVYTAELYALYLFEEQQGRGYGKALMLALTETFIRQGHGAMLLWVLSTNPARRFYEAMGGTYLKTKLIEIGGESLEEVAYGWDDLSVLVRGCFGTGSPVSPGGAVGTSKTLGDKVTACKVDKGFARGRQGFVVFSESAGVT